MTADSLAHVELYVHDDAEALAHFTSALDFTPTAVSHRGPAGEPRRSTLLTGGSARLVVTAPTHASDGVAAHLQRHGEGVVDVAFGCRDVPAAYRRAVAAGAAGLCPPSGRRAAARVGGFGSVTHTLVPVTAPLPPGDWRVTGAARPATARQLDHVAVCLTAGTLQATATRYGRAFGLDRFSAEYTEVGDQAMESLVVRNSAGTVTFTMIQPDATRAPGQIDAFLATNGGPGVQHLAFLVDDVVDAVRRLGPRGVDFLPTPDAYYDRLAEVGAAPARRLAAIRSAGVLLDQDEWGHLLQIFTRSPHRDGGLFYELIQRERARGFGSANIRALYEAVRRTEAAGASSR